MKSWLVSVGILFVLVEAFSWLKNFILPLPIYLFAGAFIAIASNYDKGITVLFRQKSAENESVMTQTAALIEARKAIQPESISQNSAK
ncbi:MAG TPA: hypothetical protein ACFCUY_13660 [Xenococcaceae cyanobacterium]|jgi:hypothetical protein